MKKIIFALLLPLAFGACKKDSTATETEKKLVAGVWTEKEHWLDEDNNGALELAQYDNDCNTDDEYRFESGGNFSYNDGTNHCEPDFPIAIEGEWQLQNNDTELQWVFDFDNDTLHFEILEITDNQLVINRFFPDDPAAQPFEKIVLIR